MDDTDLEKLLKEILAAYATTQPVVEGLEDFARLNILPASQSQVADLHTQMRRRLDLLDAAAKALQALREDGYPALPIVAVPEEVYVDLAAQKKTIDAALRQFESETMAAIAVITAGTPEPK